MPQVNPSACTSFLEVLMAICCGARRFKVSSSGARIEFVVRQDGLVGACAAGGFGFEVTDDGDALPAAGQDQSTLPGQALPIDQRQGWVAARGGFSYKSEPGIDLQFFQNGGGLLDFLKQEG